MNRVKRKGTIRKVEPSAQLLVEETFTFQRAILKAIYNHGIPAHLVRC